MIIKQERTFCIMGHQVNIRCEQIYICVVKPIINKNK